MDTPTVATRVTIRSSGRQRLELRRLRVEERMSTPFRMELEVMGAEGLRLDRLLGTSVAIRLTLAGGRVRYFHGIVDEVEVQRSKARRQDRYRLILGPTLTRLARSSDRRTFASRSLPDIAEQVLDEHDVAVRFDLVGDHEPLDFVVQYGETDLELVHRLLHEAGIHYWFRHDADRHVMVLCDSDAEKDTVAGYGTISMLEAGEAGEGLVSLEPRVEARYERVEVDDHDFRQPTERLGAASGTTRRGALASIAFDYPGGYVDRQEGQRRAAARVGARRAGRSTSAGVAASRGLAAGSAFELVGHERDDQNGGHVTIETVQRIVAGPRTAAGPGVATASWSCDVVTTPLGEPMSTPAARARPELRGPHTGTIVGPAGWPIYTDELGRVKVRFHWDRYTVDEAGTPWVRVAQQWAGADRGAMVIPRVGDEVLVEFEHGDARRPIVVGSLWNGESEPPVELPDDRAKTVWRTRSLDGSSANELVFDDAPGQEQLNVVAARDQGLIVGGDRTITVGGAQTETIGTNRSRRTGGDDAVSVDGDAELTIDGIATVAIGSGMAVTADDDVAVTGERNIRIAAGDDVEIVGPRSSIIMKRNGDVVIKGNDVTVHASGQLRLKGAQVVEDEG